MMGTEPALFEHICTAPDTAGNARRLYAIYGKDGSLLACIDEWHFGRPRWFDDLLELPAVSVSAREYQQWPRHREPRPDAYPAGSGAAPGASKGRSVRMNPPGTPPLLAVNCVGLSRRRPTQSKHIPTG